MGGYCACPFLVFLFSISISLAWVKESGEKGGNCGRSRLLGFDGVRIRGRGHWGGRFPLRAARGKAVSGGER